MSCKGCQLLVDGVVVVDVYQPIITGTAITLQSPCLTLTPNAVSTGGLEDLYGGLV